MLLDELPDLSRALIWGLGLDYGVQYHTLYHLPATSKRLFIDEVHPHVYEGRFQK
jgi:hypothetical protein